MQSIIDRRAAIEYALIVSLVAGAAIAGMIALGISLDLSFTSVSGQVVAQTPIDPPRCVHVGSNCRK